MSQSNIRLANDHRLASEQRTRTIGDSSLLVDYQEVAISNIGSQPLPLAKYFTNASSMEMAVDGSTPVDFAVTPGATEIYRVESLVLVMALAAASTMTAFGDIAGDLGVGLTLDLLDADGAVIADLLGGTPIRSNNDLATVGTVIRHEVSTTHTLKAVIVPGSPLRIEGGDEEKLRIKVSDNLSGITRMRCFLRGRLETSIS